MLGGMGVIGTVSGCTSSGDINEQPTSDAAAPPASSESSVPANPTDPIAPEDNDAARTPALDQTLISEEGLGAARLGMTLGDLKQTLGTEVEFNPQSPFIVDFDAIAVQHNGDTLFHLLHLAGEPLQDNEAIQGILTTNTRFQTAEGVGVGTPIQTAEEAYGDATLSYNTGNESREYVRFERHPASNISFGTQSSGAEASNTSSFAGLYDNATAQYNETQQYQDGASIQAILLVCLSASCSQ